MLLLIVVLLIAISLFVNLSPEFGGKATDEQLASYEVSDNYESNRFVNPKKIDLSMSFGNFRKSIREYFSNPNTIPKTKLAVQKIDSLNIANYEGSTRVIWFGHSAFLLQIDGKKILIDPMLGEVPAPHPWLGNKRFAEGLPINIDQLPVIDAVLISHDHYDHLDYGSIQKLKDKVKMFYTPLGVGVHLQAWGIDATRIIELDWWQQSAFEGLQFICTPAQHFSGRGLTDQSATLWSSWVIQSKTENIFFSGDSAYSNHFKEIGAKYGPFDFAMLECGQYNEMWPDVHMFPEETVQAGIDLNAKTIMPIHWGAFKLAMHPWTDPVARITKKAKELNVNLLTPQIGAPISVHDVNITDNDWWKTYE